MARTLREKSSDLRRGHILEAATRVFARRGFHRSTIRDIAIEAGVADGTIYNSFENKTALLTALLDPLDGRSSPRSVTAPVIDDAEAFVRAMLRQAWTRFDDTTLEVARIVLSEALVDGELRALYLERIIIPAVTLPEPIFASLVASGHLRPIDPALVARALACSVMGFVSMRLLGDARTIAEWETLPDRIADLLLHGLLDPEHGQPA